MSKDKFILSEWEKEKMDKLKELARLEDAKIEGHEAGYSEGHSSGYSDGKSDERITIAKNLLAKNITKEIISDCTGLTIEEITNLEN